MEMRARRALAPILLAATVLLLAGRFAVPASAASVDLELVAQSVTEDGYYVDSDAAYYKSDTDLDKLRAALQTSGKAGVVVLPAGTAAGPVLTRLLRSPNRKATYIVLTGTRLQAASNSLPRATVAKMTAQAEKAGGPKQEVLAFLDLLTAKKRGANTKNGHKAGSVAAPADSAAADSATPSAAPAAAAEHDSGGNGPLYGIAAAVVVVAAAIGGLLLWRRKKGTAETGGALPGA